MYTVTQATLIPEDRCAGEWGRGCRISLWGTDRVSLLDILLLH